MSKDNENNRWKRNAKKENKVRKEQGRQKLYERMRAKWFCCAFK